jgi:hypothetical protein
LFSSPSRGNAEAFDWPNLEGEWATVQVLMATADLPVLGSVTIHTVIGALTHITQSGSRLILQDRYCFTHATPSSWLFRTQIADHVMQSISPPHREVDLRMEDCDLRFEQDWYTEVRGAILADPEMDALPSEPSDPRVFDLDGDGHPGITIQASILGLMNGECYAVQRYRYRLNGTVFDANTIVGYVDWTSEQNVLDATHTLFMEPFTDDTHPDPSVHRFLMIRTDGSWTCDTLKEHLPEMVQLLEF